jgi:hypothetical protein
MPFTRLARRHRGASELHRRLDRGDPEAPSRTEAGGAFRRVLLTPSSWAPPQQTYPGNHQDHTQADRHESERESLPGDLAKALALAVLPRRGDHESDAPRYEHRREGETDRCQDPETDPPSIHSLPPGKYLDGPRARVQGPRSSEGHAPPDPETADGATFRRGLTHYGAETTTGTPEANRRQASGGASWGRVGGGRGHLIAEG